MEKQASGRKKQVFVLAAMLAVGGGAAGWLAVTPWNPLDRAIDKVAAGEVTEGCLLLEKNLEGAPEAELGRAELDAAKTVCVDSYIDGALGADEPTQRELELLALAAPGRALTPTAAQLERIETEVAKLPGALQNGKGRITPVSYEVHGPISTKPVRAAFLQRLPQLRACHAAAALGERELEGSYTLRMRIERDGKVSGVTTVAGRSSVPSREHVKNETLDACVREVLTGAELATVEEAASMVLVELFVRPMRES